MTVGFCRLIGRTPLHRAAAPARVPYRSDEQQRTVPSTYSSSRHEVDAVVATSNPIRRHFGTEILITRRESVDLGLLDSYLPLLDCHDESKELGRVVSAWFEQGQLRATLRFSSSRRGRQAEEMVRRGELLHVSCHAGNTSWSAKDTDGNAIRISNPDFQNWGGTNQATQIFTATRWRLLEVSLTHIPVDPAAVIL